MKKHTWNLQAWVLYCLIFSSICLISCRRYYMPVGRQVNTSQEANMLVKQASEGRYLILHSRGSHYHMRAPEFDELSQAISFYPGTVSMDHMKYIQAKKEKYNYRKSEAAVLTETHLYIADSIAWTHTDSALRSAIPIAAIQKVEFIAHDKDRTTSSYVVGGLAIAGAVAVVAGVIALLSSCPYVSVPDGNAYVPQGELFGGAVYPTLERKDFLPLKVAPSEGVFSVKIHNELKEVQHINYAQLRVIEHNEGEKAYVSQDGKVFLVGALEKPVSAVLNETTDQLASLSGKDFSYVSFNDTGRTDGVNQLRVRFRKPAGATEARLVLSARGTLWFEYLYGSFTSAFGKNYASWVSSRQSAPASNAYQWMESQQIPLHIAVNADGGLVSVEKILPIGPLMCREVVVPVKLPVSDAGYIDLTLSTGLMFWEIDYAGISFEKSGNYAETILKPSKAVDEKGVDVLRQVMEKDSLYVVQPLAGNALFLEYNWNRTLPKGRAISIVLEGSGYYQPIRAYEGEADVTWLTSFRNPGRFPAFSREKYLEVRKMMEPAVAKK